MTLKYVLNRDIGILWAQYGGSCKIVFTCKLLIEQYVFFCGLNNMFLVFLSYDVASGGLLTSCIRIDNNN